MSKIFTYIGIGFAVMCFITLIVGFLEGDFEFYLFPAAVEGVIGFIFIKIGERTEKKNDKQNLEKFEKEKDDLMEKF